jgi:hypothetical protein
MKNRAMGVVGAVAVAALLSGVGEVGAQEKARPATKASPAANAARVVPSEAQLAAAAALARLAPSEAQIAKIKILEAYRALVYTPPQDCTSMDPCTVTITLDFIPYNGSTYCIATFPASLTFHNTVSTNPPKTINWIFDPGPMFVEFHTSSGILLVDNPKQQIKPDPSRTNAVTFSAKNKHNDKGVTTYVPVLLYRTAAGQPPNVCATGDPQIAND